MLESQPSSISISSVQSQPKEDSLFSSVFPEKYKSIVSKKYFDKFSCSIEVMISSECEVIECRKGEVINYLDLKGYFNRKIPANLKNENVKFDIILSEDCTIYVIKINSTLFGVERKSSQLKVLKVHQNVKSMEFALDESSNKNDVLVLITFNDNKQQLTKFLDEDLEEFLKNNNSQQFQGILESVSQKTIVAQTQLNNLNREIEEMMLKLRPEIPSTMLSDVSFI